MFSLTCASIAYTAVTLSTIVRPCWAQTMLLDQTIENRRYCREIFDGNSWFGRRSHAISLPEISVRFQQVYNDTADPILSLVIFEKRDGNLGGLQLHGQTHYICTHEAIDGGLCQPEEYGAFIGRHDEAAWPLLSIPIHMHSPQLVKFPVTRSGAYCVEAIAYTVHEFQAWAMFESRRGLLPAVQLGKLHFSLYTSVLTLITAITLTAATYKRVRYCDPSLTAFAWIFFTQSLIGWTNLTALNNHSYRYRWELLRSSAVAFVLLRYAAVLYLWLRLIQKAGKTQSSPSTLPRVSFYFSAAALCWLMAAKENEVLQERNESRDTFLISLTVAASSLLLTIHLIVLKMVYVCLEMPPQDLQLHRKFSCVSARWVFVALMLFIASMSFFAFVVLLSWIRADEYGGDLLSQMWTGRWFFLDEWHTVVCLVDVLCMAQIWPLVDARQKMEPGRAVKVEIDG